MRASEFVSEKWSEKYKRSINCSNPRGFSQRAHCAGRRKNEDLNEFAPGGGDDDDRDPEDVLFRLAQMWYTAPDIATEQRAEQALAKLGWEIGGIESDEGGAFVVEIGDDLGNSYIAWTAEDLEQLNEFAPGDSEGNGPFDYGRAIVEIGQDFSQQYNDEGAEADARAIIRVGQTFMSKGMTAGIQAFYRLDTQIRDHVAEQLEYQGFNVRQDIYANGPMAPAQRDTGAQDQKNILALLKAFVKTRTEPEDRKTVAEIYQAFQQGLAQGFAALHNAWEFDIDADFIDFARDYGVDINAIAGKHGQQLDELTFKGSPCTKDCSGHRAGYEWSLRKGKRHAASWSRSFNNGAAIAVAGL